jgi:hypothetical protein
MFDARLIVTRWLDVALLHSNYSNQKNINIKTILTLLSAHKETGTGT